MPPFELPRQPGICGLERRQAQVVVMVPISTLASMAIDLTKVVVGEERKAGVPLEAIEEALEAGRRLVVVVFWLAHAVGTAVRKGLFFGFEIMDSVQLNISRRCHPQWCVGICVWRDAGSAAG